MDTFKKIYILIMGLVVIALGYLFFASTGTISTDGVYTERLLVISYSILLVSFLLSRSSNVIANRKNTAFAYIAVFIGLLFILGSALELIFNFELSFSLIYIIICIILGVTLPILILEVPPANSAHTKFQIITVIIVLITFIWYSMDLYNSLKMFYADTDEITISEETEEDNNSESIKLILTYVSIGLFLLNPMIRVHYLDVDYELTNDIDKIIKEGVSSNNQPKKVVPEKVTIPKKEEKTPEIQTGQVIEKAPVEVNIPNEEVIQPIQEIVESQGMSPDGKVINPMFKEEQDDLPDAVIPTIDGLNNEEEKKES